jgi:hypothetical protein
MSYSEKRRARSDKHLPQIKGIIGPLMLEESSFEIDTQEATDLMVMTARDIRIACRVRDFQYMEKYGNEFTIRRYSNGNETEMHKIIGGWGDWMFYGFSTEDDSSVARWFLIDLDVFRYNLIQHQKRVRTGRKPNGDGTELQWFDVRSFTPNILIAASHPVAFFHQNRSAA